MNSKVFRFVLALVLALILAPLSSYSGGPRQTLPPLDHSLTAFKEIGVWYFLCVAPTYHHRIPPHFETYGPPPPPCYPMPCAPPRVPGNVSSPLAGHPGLPR